MKGLSSTERRLLREILSTGDFRDEDEAAWNAFDDLEDRGLCTWVNGPRTRRFVERFPDDPDVGEPIDPKVTELGKLVLAACLK